MIHREELQAALADCPIGLLTLDCVDSTNAEARRLLQKGACEPIAILADRQTAGRGRMGRSFYSPAQTGIYLTLLLPMRGALAEAVSVTAVAAVAVHRAIARVTGIETEIKWVNDLYRNGRKVCGILAESAVREAERYLILGVGVNLSTVDFPEELRSIAGSLSPADSHLRDVLAAKMIRLLYEYLAEGQTEDWLSYYRRHSLVLGREVRYIQNQTETVGVAEAIDDEGRLLVRHADGTLVTLASGEITLRLKDLSEKEEGETT